MNRAIEILSAHGFAGLMAVVALVLGALALRQRQRAGSWSGWLLVPAAGCLLAGLGSEVLPAPRPDDGFLSWPALLAAAVGLVLFGKVLALLLTGAWWRPLAWVAGAAGAFALGGWFGRSLGRGAVEAGRSLASLEPAQPWWLLLLGLVPLVVLWSYRSLAGLGPVRRWVAIGLRSSLIILLALALAEVRLRHQSESVTVLFVLDRSQSVPEETEKDAKTGNVVDHRWERVRKFINDAVEFRGAGHERDRAGLIVFGRRPRLELPPSDAPRFKFTEVTSAIDSNYTDVAAAIKLALASFPEDTGKRIVLISDGNENLGSAEEQARLAKIAGAQIDAVPLGSGQRNENEVLVQGVEAPALVEQGTQLPLRVLVRSFNPAPVVGTLVVKQITRIERGDEARVVEKLLEEPPRTVTLRQGLNSFQFKQPLTDQQQSYTYEAEFQPLGVRVDDRHVRALTGDRVQNNRAATHVVARGQRRVLFVEDKKGDHDLLVQSLLSAGDKKFKVLTMTAEELPKDKERLGVYLSNFDCVALANVAAEKFGDTQMEMIRSNTHEQGCGLVMIGGPEGFGAGGWQGTAVEKALPVDCDIRALKVDGKGGLVLIFHASEIADGVGWQKKVAKLAIEKLSPVDMVGMTCYGFGGHVWQIPFQTVGENRNRLLRLVDTMMPGDMPDVDPALEMAYKELTNPAYDLAKRHIIFISDGDHWMASLAVLQKLRAAKISCSTVCITSHGNQERAKMYDVAQRTGGKAYAPTSPNQLPAIYTQEARKISQSFVAERKFPPRLVFRSGPTDRLPDPLADLYGFVRTTPKASALVEMPIETPPFADQKFPILAYWHYGLGKAVAFTSGAGRGARDQKGNQWDQDWARSAMFAKFWEQVFDWAMRPVESKRLAMTTEYRDGVVRVIVDARNEQGDPDIGLTLRGGVTVPGSKPGDGRKEELRFEQKSGGVYEAEFKADESGSYFITAQATRREKVKDKDGKETGQEVEAGIDSIRSGVTIPYSPEFSDLESNPALLAKLSEMTGGKVFSEDALAQAAGSGEVFRAGLPLSKSMQPVWYWLLFLTAVLLFFDVAVRRIAVEPAAAWAGATRVWDRLRGRAVVAPAQPQFFDRLQSRKAQVGEELGRVKAARRFDAGSAPAGEAPPGAAQATPGEPQTAPRPVRPAPSVAPEREQEAVDYASRLMKAKKRVWQDRDKDKEQ